jgi:hypothetical protein
MPQIESPYFYVYGNKITMEIRRKKVHAQFHKMKLSHGFTTASDEAQPHMHILVHIACSIPCIPATIQSVKQICMDPSLRMHVKVALF